ncbi:DUF533 domain-containing protein [Xanthobacter autotrophicus DSM 431]|uniref:tellurite resistance TerB family protein n=1 Tax=Xanthobacter nonsaccharivorans TaxID=3119912 RepID=UPI00372A48E5
MADAGSLLGQLIGAAIGGGSGGVRGGSSVSGGSPLDQILKSVLEGQGAPGGPSGQSGGGLPGGLGDILGQVLGGGQPGGDVSSGRAQGGPSGLPGGLGDILGQVLGGGGRPGGGQGQPSGGLPGGLGDILGQVLGGGAPSGGGLSGGAASGSLGDLASEALGRGGSTPAGSSPGALPDADPAPAPAPTPAPQSGGGAGDLLKYGGLAVIGMMAWNAFRKWQAQSGDGRAAFTSGTPEAAGFSPTQAPGGAAAFSGVLLAAMAAAAQADGEIDDDELQRITGGLARMGAGTPEQDALATFLTTPVDPRQVVSAATSPEAALQIYAASAMAIRPDNAAERQYLENLAGALGIDPGLKAQVDRDLNA